jgi:hypothetical protein
VIISNSLVECLGFLIGKSSELILSGLSFELFKTRGHGSLLLKVLLRYPYVMKECALLFLPILRNDCRRLSQVSVSHG